MKTEPQSRLVLLVSVAMLAVVPAALAQPVIANGCDFGTQSIGVLDGFGLTATGGAGGPYTWTLASGQLPPGVSIRTDLASWLQGTSASANLAGVAITAGVWNSRIRVTDASGSAEQDCTIRISSLVVKDYWNLADAFVGEPYSHTLSALRKDPDTSLMEGVSPTWTVQPNTLPPGMSLGPTTGELFGTPTTSGFYTIRLTATEGGESVSRTQNLSVFDVKITTPGNLPNATQGVNYPSTTITASGGTGIHTFAATGLPSGLVMDTDGTIHGNTTQRGPRSLNVTATDSNFRSYTRRMSLDVIGAPKALPSIAPYQNAFEDCVYGTPCSRGISVSSGGTAPFTWSAQGLPSGMEIRSAGDAGATPNYTPADAELWGVTASLGIHNVTITVTDADGMTATNTFPLKVSEIAMNGTGPSTVWTRDVFATQVLRIVGGPSKPDAFAPAPDGSTLYTVELLPSTFGSQTGLPPAGVSLSPNVDCPTPLRFCGTPIENVQISTRLRFTTSGPGGGQQLETSYGFSVGGGTSTIQITTNSNLGTSSSGSNYSNQLNACCSPNGLTWTPVGGSLAGSGLSLSPSGLLSGVAAATGVYTFMVRAADSMTPTNYGQRQFTIAVTSTTITGASTLPYGSVGTPYSASLTTAGGGTWSLSPFSYLPPGVPAMSLSAAGLVSGTPTQSGQYQFSVTVSSVSGPPAIRTYTLSIYPAGASPPVDFSINNQGPFSLDLVTITLSGASGGSGTYVYSLTPGATHVPGLRLQNGPPFPTSVAAGTTAALMGVATTPGVHNTSIRVADSAAPGNYIDRATSVTVTDLQILSQAVLPKATMGTAYSFNLTPYGGSLLYQWSATGLPVGMNINGATGEISGTAGAAIVANVTVTLKDQVSPVQISRSFTLTVDAFAITTPGVFSGVLPSGTVGIMYSQPLGTTAGGAGAWSLSGAPGGLAIGNGAVIAGCGGVVVPAGVICGTATATFNGSITVTRGTVSKIVSLRIVAATPQALQITNSPPVIVSSSIGNFANSVLAASGGTPSGTAPFYGWTIESGSLPPGITLNSDGAVIGANLAPGFSYLAGRFMQTGVYTFTVRATDSSAPTPLSVTRTITWIVTGLASSYSSLPPTAPLTIANGVPFTTNNRLLVLGGSAAEGTGNYTFANTTPLPYGLVLNPATGEITGTPTEQTVGALSVTFQVTDSGVMPSTRTFNVNFTVGGTSLVNFGANANFGVVPQGTGFSQNLTLTGGTPPYSVNVVGGSLPPGFEIISGNALFTGAPANSVFLVGTPLASGAFTFTLEAQDSAAVPNIRQRTFTLAVAPFTLGISNALPDAAVNDFYSHTLITSTSAGPVTWSLTSGFSLPPGLGLAGNVLSGTPTVASATPPVGGSYSFSLDATAGGVVRTQTFSLKVAPVGITGSQIITTVGVVGAPYSHTFIATTGGSPVWFVQGQLPAGFSLSSTGLLTNPSPQTAGGFTFTLLIGPNGINCLNNSICQSRRFTVVIREPNPTVLDFPYTNAALADVTIGQSSTLVLSGVTGGLPPYTWSVAPGSSLPPGLSLVEGSAQGTPMAAAFLPGQWALAGAPSTAGQYTFDLILHDSTGAQARRTLSLKVSPLALIAGTVKNGTIGSAYAQQFTTVGGTAPYTYTMTPVNQVQEMLPPNVTLSAAGLVSTVAGQTLTSTGNYAYVLRVQDSAGNTFSRRTQFTVVNNASVCGNGSQACNLFISNNNPNDASIGIGRRATMVLAVGSTSGFFGNYTWSVTPGSSTPPGMGLFSNEDLLTQFPGGSTIFTGQPTTAGTFVFSLRATDNANAANFADRTFRLRVSPMQIVSPPVEATVPPDLPIGEAGVPYPPSTLLTAGGTPPYTYVESPFVPLPTGMTLSSAGVLSGTPLSIGVTIVAPIVTDSTGKVLNGSPMSLVVKAPASSAPLLIGSVGSFLTGSVGVPFAAPLDLSVRGGTPPYTWNVAAGSSMPPGLALIPPAAGSGVSTYLGGTPTVASTTESFEFSLQVHDSSGQSYTRAYEFLASSIALTPDTIPPGIVGTPYTASLAWAGTVGSFVVFAIPDFSLPPGLTLNAAGVLQGTPTAPGNFPMMVAVGDSTDNYVVHLYRIAIDNPTSSQPLGEAPAVSLSPTPIQLFHTTGSPNPSPMPISVNATSGTFSYNLSMSGLPPGAATLSSLSGTAPAVVNLNWNLTAVAAGEYHGILAVRAQSVNLIDHVPVTLVVQNPPPCGYSINPGSGSIGAAGGAGSFNLSAGPTCAWTVAADPGITIDSASSGLGSSTVDFNMPANAGVDPLSGAIRLYDGLGVVQQVYLLTQFGSSCSFAINPTSLSAPSAGGSAVVNITASNPACVWTASGLGAAPSGGTGNASVTVTIPPNTTFPFGTDLLATIAGQAFKVHQAGYDCAVGLSPYEASSPAGGGSGSFAVTIPPGCSYDTAVGPSWVSVTSGGSGSASGTLVYEVQPNSATLPRVGTLTINGQPFQITQEAIACSVTIDTSGLGSPYGPAAGFVGSVGVVTNGANCSWIAGSGAAWASLSTNAGTGNGTLNVSVTANASATTSRTTDLTIAGQTVAISQAGLTCTYNLQSAAGSVPASAASGTAGVVAPGVCEWTATSDAGWLAIVSSGSAGTANVLFSTLQNATAVPRVATLTIHPVDVAIPPKVYTVTQAAAPCSYNLAPGNHAGIDPAGIPSATVAFTATNGCNVPEPQSYANWVRIVSTTGGASGTIEYSVDPNPTTLTRSTTVRVGDQNFAISQFGGTCGYSLNAYGAVFRQPGGPGTVLGSATFGSCAPDVGTTQSFIHLSPLSGTPTLFTLPYTVDAYDSLNTSVRFGKITFGGRIYTVKQTSW
jgi:hypothetical protein